MKYQIFKRKDIREKDELIAEFEDKQELKEFVNNLSHKKGYWQICVDGEGIEFLRTFASFKKRKEYFFRRLGIK